MFSRLFFLSVMTAGTVFVFHAAEAGQANPDSEVDAAAQSEEVQPKEKAEVAPTKIEEEEEDGPVAQMRAALKALSDGLTPEEMKHFASVYNNYNMVNTVKTIRRDVSEAIKACGENNPDMKESLDTRFAKWNEAVNPVITESEANINNMVLAQDYVKKEEIQNIFNLVDETRNYTASKYEKVPVTTREACGFLLGKMDETQSAMLSLLRAGLSSYPQSTAMPAKKD